MNVEVRYSIIFIDIKRQNDALRKQCNTSKFEIPCSIFDIQHQLICGTNKNFRQNLFGSGLPGLGLLTI